MSYERTTKDSVEYIANKFAENPGHFAATILRMYWDMEKQRDQYKEERDTLIDDLAVLKANISRLERENHDLKKRNALLMNTVDDLDKENKALRLQANTYFDEWQNVKNLYTTLTNHIRMKAENNPGVSRYIDLVNYIDRLERGDGEKI